LDNAAAISGIPPICTIGTSVIGLRPCFSSSVRIAKSVEAPKRVTPDKAG
jgi:hypothetical protein